MAKPRAKTSRRTRSRAKRARPSLPQAPDARADRPLIVGIGASAGGIDAVSQLLRQLPSDTGLSFVVIQHLAPKRPSQLSTVLAHSTAMSIVEATSGVEPEADHVYVIPPGVDMALRDGRLVVGTAERDRRTPRSIDLFLHSLAEQEQDRAIGVVLSGTGTDGTEGLQAIRAQGGIALVEHPTSARFPGMPESAIAAGAADLVLAIDDLARELVELSRSPVLKGRGSTEAERLAAGDDRILSDIFALVRGVSGVDFSEYKSTTFRRRLARRMLLRRTPALADYLELLRGDAAEVAALGRDILIHVTEFFRDSAAFEALAKQVVPKLRSNQTAIRIWVPGCATGEEVYSIAICLVEALGDGPDRVPIQIFGTDVSPDMIDRARAGTYPEAAVRTLGPERLRRFFTATDSGYCVSKSIRNLCVFVKHDLTRDPPFARLDLISCRNVLIYFSASLQRRVVPLFHYCLNPGGFLLLGHAEAIAGFRGLFNSVDKTNKLFTKIGASHPLSNALPMWDRGGDIAAVPGPAALPRPTDEIQRQAESLILSRYAPPGVLIDDRLDVVHLRGRTAPFLELPPGHPNLGLLKLARPGLRPALRAAIERARKEMVAVRREGVELRDGDRVLQLTVEVIPMAAPSPRDRHFLVLFDQATETTGMKRPARAQGAAERRTSPSEVQRLREEAEATREYLQSLIDERQRMNDEMTAANEELVASNEELQSTNEEMESAKEELQSANEELTTVNDELQVRNQELNQVNSDLVNLLASIDLPIVIVSGDHRVRRFTPGAKALMNLIPGDIGRPLDDIKLNIVVDSLDLHLTEVLQTLQMKELEVVDRDGHWHRLQLRPYRTVDGRIDGAVISLTDIDVLKQAVGDATAALDQVSAVLRTIRVPLVVLDDRFAVRSANPAYYEAYGGDPIDTIGQIWFDTCDGAWDSPELRAALASALAGSDVATIEVQFDHPPGSLRTVALSASVLRWGAEPPVLLITSIDVTERNTLVKDADDARLHAVRASRSKDVFLATLSHELRGPLHAIALHADLILAGAAGTPDRARDAAHAIARSAEALERIISDLLDVSAIIAGKISLKRRRVELQNVIGAALDAVRETALSKRIDLRLEADPAVGPVIGDDTRLQQVVGNLLGNAVKFTSPGGEVVVLLDQADRFARIRVTDTGHGIAPDFLPHVFERFAQADASSARAQGGLGLGLAIVRDLVRLHGGRVRAESHGRGTGASFTVELPLPDQRAAALGGEVDEDTDPSGHHLLRLAPLEEDSRPGHLDGVRVLLVDDDAGSRDVLSEMLRFHGAVVRTVASAASAMAALDEFRPEVLLCDIAMPDEDGYKLIERIRALPPERGGDIPAVAITALASRSDRKRALSAGFQLHVAKPASIAVLCDAVRRVYVDRARTVKAGS